MPEPARKVTLFNCFVMGTIEDSIHGIFRPCKKGRDHAAGRRRRLRFLDLAPEGHAGTARHIASGPVSFMRVWDAMCGTMLSTGARRGAMMATLRCDHPDIDEFIHVKHRRASCGDFNLSVLVTDAFMAAVRDDEEWPLVFPAAAMTVMAQPSCTHWSGERWQVPCCIVRRVRARELWERHHAATYDYAEPGVLFIDRINSSTIFGIARRISSTNPCSEIPLPPYGACDLGSINLTRFVREPFARSRGWISRRLPITAVAVRLLDNVIDASRFPLPEQAEQARGTRRIGLASRAWRIR